jgi:replication factor A1
MIKIPYEQIIERIKTERNISEEEINGKIDQKMKQLSGLISKEGAAHIVANELGIKLLESFTGKLQIKNIVSGLRNVETVGKVMQTYELREFKTNDREGKLASMLIGDESGSVRVVMWGEQAENINNIKSGTVVKIIGGYVKDNRGSIELHLNDRSQVIIDPPGEKIDIDINARPQKTYERKPINKLTENDNNVQIMGTIVQIFDPRFFPVDPESGRKVTENEGKFYYNEKVIENPDYSYVLNLIVDDGTDNMRAVFFRDSMEKLLKCGREKILSYKDDPSSFEEVKSDLLGNLIKLDGRVKKNLFFDRIEILANEVFLNPNPDEEIKRLNEEVKKVENN